MWQTRETPDWCLFTVHAVRRRRRRRPRLKEGMGHNQVQLTLARWQTGATTPPRVRRPAMPRAPPTI
eukprot:7380040-Prymnesium_polylepis.2